MTDQMAVNEFHARLVELYTELFPDFELNYVMVLKHQNLEEFGIASNLPEDYATDLLLMALGQSDGVTVFGVEEKPDGRRN